MWLLKYALSCFKWSNVLLTWIYFNYRLKHNPDLTKNTSGGSVLLCTGSPGKQQSCVDKRRTNRNVKTLCFSPSPGWAGPPSAEDQTPSCWCSLKSPADTNETGLRNKASSCCDSSLCVYLCVSSVSPVCPYPVCSWGLLARTGVWSAVRCQRSSAACLLETAGVGCLGSSGSSFRSQRLHVSQEIREQCVRWVQKCYSVPTKQDIM